jgi:hypothetical protein
MKRRSFAACCESLIADHWLLTTVHPAAFLFCEACKKVVV